MTTHENLYEDIGSHARPTAYDDCGHVKCEVCGAPPGKACINPVAKPKGGKPATRHMPCIGRIVRSSTPGEPQ